ncbi:hypothetical protein [Cupriavidus sp. H39]
MAKSKQRAGAANAECKRDRTSIGAITDNNADMARGRDKEMHQKYVLAY